MKHKVIKFVNDLMSEYIGKVKKSFSLDPS